MSPLGKKAEAGWPERERRANQPQQVGIIDLGSNTARLAVYRYIPGTWYRLTDSIREPTRLAEGATRDGKLKRKAMERAQAAVELFADFAEAAGLPHVEVLATSAVREAQNGDEMLARIAPLDLPLAVLSGSDEAQLGVLAVANSVEYEDAWVIDLGGGSVQVSSMIGRRFEHGQAYPLGAVRMTEEALGGGHKRITKKMVKKLESRVSKELSDITRLMAADKRPIVALGGSVRNLARIVQRQTSNYPIVPIHGYRLTRDAVEQLTVRLLQMTAAERAAVPGLNLDRADIIPAAALVYRWILRSSGRERITISGDGMREGAFHRHFLPAPHLVRDVRTFGVMNVFGQYEQPLSHTDKVRSLSLSLFDQLETRHQLSSSWREILWAAATLHDIGMTIDYHRHHRHGQMLVEASPLPGWTHREQAIIAQLIRHHRKGEPVMQELAEVLDDQDCSAFLVLVTLLRIAESLERSRTGRVAAVRIHLKKSAVKIDVFAEEEPAIEIWEAGKHASLFERALDRPLEIRWKEPS